MRGTRRGNAPLKADGLSEGIALAQAGDLGAAEAVLSRALLRAPGDAESHNNLGLVLQRLGRMDEAIASFRRALAIRPTYMIALTNLGAALAGIERHVEAVASYEAALAQAPADLAALNNLAASLVALGRDEDAITRLRTLVEQHPGLAEAHLNLGRLLAGREAPLEAMAQLRIALSLSPDDPDAHLALGNMLLAAGGHGEALDHFAKAAVADPNAGGAHAGRGRALQEIGDLGGARAAFRQAIMVEPGVFAHYLNLAHITKLAPDDPALLAMIAMASRIDELADDDRVNAHFGLGKALADVGRHEEAFAHLLAGAACKRRNTDYDETRALGGLRRLEDALSHETLRKWPRSSAASAEPVFILGMPRSGSTLVEQILARHPEVACAGESLALRQVLRQVRADDPDWRYPDPRFVPTEAQLSRVAGLYLERLRREAYAPDHRRRSRITDKMPGNFRHIGLIAHLFPGARIIHTFRDPIETCLSCFAINFVNQPFTYDLGELGRYYRGYARLMRHWKRILPEDAIFDVRYEAVVLDFEASARAIVAHCGLDWDDACLRFHEAERPVKTASVEQVRQPIYKTSLRRWRPDAETLRPLLEGLGIDASRLLHPN